MARFLIDESLPASLINELDTIGHEAVHVYELGLRGASDELVYERAVTEQRIVLTSDLGFGNILRFSGPAGVVIVRTRRKMQIGEVVRQTIDLLAQSSQEIEDLGATILVLEPGRKRVRRRPLA